MDITCLGIILVDMFPGQVGVPLVEVTSFSPKPGGAPANVAVSAQRMGSSAAFIGKVGEDLFGHRLKEVLTSEGVQTQGMVFDDKARTTLVFIGMPDAHNAEFVFYRNPGADMMLTLEDLNLEILKDSKALHFDSLSLTHPNYLEATMFAMDVVKRSGGFISYDVNYRPTMWPSPEDAIQAARFVLPLCDVIKVNEIELGLLTGETDFDKGAEMILNEGGQLCLVTLGMKGSYYFTRQSKGFVPAYPVETIDSIGCGDAFLGAILHQLTQFSSLDSALASGQLETIVQFAAAAGALTATKRGALPAIPYRSEVETFLLNHS
jgi:fructokinase